MGRRLVQIDPTIVMEFITEGNAWGVDKVIRVVEGIPADAKFVRGWYMPELGEDGVFTLLVEHPSWSDITNHGARYPTFVPKLATEYKEDPYPAYLPCE